MEIEMQRQRWAVNFGKYNGCLENVKTDRPHYFFPVKHVTLECKENFFLFARSIKALIRQPLKQIITRKEEKNTKKVSFSQ